MYHSIIIEESLENSKVLENYKILRTKFEPAERPDDINWHLHIIEILELEKAIKEFQAAMVSNKPYYFHIYDEGSTLVVVFKDKVFHLNPNDQSTWKDARTFGASKLGIPPKQLDFYPSRISEEDNWFMGK